MLSPEIPSPVIYLESVRHSTLQERVIRKEFEGVRIPFASLELLIETKQTVREKDAIDRLYLKRIISEQKL